MYKPVEQVAQSLRRYDPDMVLDFISQVSARRVTNPQRFATELAKHNLDERLHLRHFQLAFVCKLVLHFYEKKRRSRRQRQFDLDDLVALSQSVVGHQDPNAYPVNNHESFHRLMIRLAYQQFPDLYGDGDVLARTHLLYQTCAQAVGSSRGYDINKAYKNATGLTIDQVWDITLAIWGSIQQKGTGMLPGPIRAGDLSKRISDIDMEHYLDMFSLNPHDFNSVARSSTYNVDPHETFNPNPLVSWPIIRLDGNSWMIPILPYLFRRATEQAFYDMIKTHGRQFATFFGYVFEDYARRILEPLGDDHEVIPEQEYMRNGDRVSTCDFIVVKDGDAVLIECKTKRLKLKTKFTADRELLRNDLTDVGKKDGKSSVTHAVRQLYLTERDIRNGCPGLETLRDKITGRFHPVVLTLDPYYLANAPYIKSIVAEELKKGEPQVEHYDWHTMDPRTFQQLCALAPHKGLTVLLENKSSTTNAMESEMGNFLHNLATGELGMAFVPVHPVIKDELNLFLRQVRERYGIS